MIAQHMSIKQMAGSIRIMHKELLRSAGATFRFPEDLDFLYRSIPTDKAGDLGIL